MRKSRKVLLSMLAIMAMISLMSAGLTGCLGAQAKPSLALGTATIQSPDILESGVLHVGFDTSKPPYSYLENGNIVGLDVDIAAAVAEKMGLKLEKVDIAGQDINKALQNGTIDVAMKVSSEVQSDFTENQIGPYLLDGTAIFAVGHSDEKATLDTAALFGVKIAAQEQSRSGKAISDKYGSDNLVAYPKLDQAFEALAAGTTTYAAADAVIGSFLANNMTDIRCIGMLGETQRVYMGVAQSKQTLATKLTDALRSLRDGGNLSVIVSKWLGSVSSQTVLNADAITAQTGSQSTSTSSGSGVVVQPSGTSQNGSSNN